MDEIGHRLVGFLDDFGNFQALRWNNTNEPVFFDDLYKYIYECNEQIGVFMRIYANLRKPKIFGSVQIEAIKKRRAEGASLRTIAKEMGCSEGTIRNYLKCP